MKRYPAYKDSGIKWIGEVPNQWHIKRLKYLDKTIMGQSLESDDCNKDGVGIPFLQGNADFSGLNPKPSVWCKIPNKLAEKDDVLLSVRAPVGAVNIADQAYGIGRGLCAIRPKHSHKKYSYYRAVCLSDELNRIATGSTYTAISVDEVNNVIIPAPPFDEQELISTYIDLKTAQIDDLIAKKERMIELLKEERTAIINQAVTSGIDPDVEMKDSGIDWLGKVPKHWGIKRLKYLVKLINEKGAINDNSIRVDLENIESWTGQLIKTDSTAATDEEMKQFIPGDVLFNKLRPYLAKVFHARQEGICGGELLVLRPSVQIDSKFLYYRAISNDFIRVIDGSTYGTKMPRASWDFIGNLFIPYSSIEDQRRIVDFFDRKTAQIDAQVAREQRSIDLLKEYRTSLISEVVTGKIDVRG